jgi:hypothetical protein
LAISQFSSYAWEKNDEYFTPKEKRELTAEEKEFGLYDTVLSPEDYRVFESTEG